MLSLNGNTCARRRERPGPPRLARLGPVQLGDADARDQSDRHQLAAVHENEYSFHGSHTECGT